VGHRFGFLDRGEDIEGIMESLHEALLYAARVGVFSEWHHLLFYLNAILAPSMKGMVYTVRFIQKHIDLGMNEKRTLPKPDDKTPVDFITRFLLLKKVSPEKVSKQDIESAAMNNFGAGSDTTSVSLCGILYFLCKHPGVLSKLRSELDGVLSRGEITEPITYKEAQKLPYLQAVIKESLRLHPPAGLPMGRVVPQGGATVAGVFFPAGVGPNSDLK
jgi:cytochrome P450